MLQTPARSHPTLRVVAPRIAAVVLLHSICCRAQKPPTMPVDVAVRIFSIDKNDAVAINNRDFRLTQDRRKLAFTVERFPLSRSIHTYALLDLAHCTAQSPTPAEIDWELAALFKLGWRVSVLDTAHTQTPYAGSVAEYATTNPVPRRSELDAVSSLNSNIGRHVIFTLCAASRSLPLPVAQGAELAMAPLLAINPGSPVYGPAYGAPNSYGPPVLSGDAAPTAYFSSFGGLVRDRILPALWPLDQPTFRDALETAKALNDQFFILHVPESPIVPQLKLRVHIEGYADTRFRILAQSYTERDWAPKILLDPK